MTGIQVKFRQGNVNRKGDRLTHSKLANFGAFLNMSSSCERLRGFLFCGG